MNKQYRVLVLTDHSGHSDQNSIYAILREMSLHPQCTSITVASRGLSINDEFFTSKNEEKLYGTTASVDFDYDSNGKAFTSNLKQVYIHKFDLLFLRLPRPISDEFLLWLNDVFHSIPIINNPIGIIETSSKSFLTNFDKVCPHLKWCKSIDDVKEFASQYPIVLKPLREYGGRGVVRVENGMVDDGQSKIELSHYLKSIESDLLTDGILAMKFLKNVTQGDKRILVVNGNILAASLRIPPNGSWLCNVAQGGTSVPSDVTQKEREIIQQISPLLIEKGIVIFGADTLVDDDGSRVLSEINTLSIGGFPQAQKQTNKPIIKQLLDNMFSYADDYKR